MGIDKQQKLSHQILKGDTLKSLLDTYDVEGIEKRLKMWVRINATHYKANMLRSKATVLHKEILLKHFPIEDYPEKHI